MQIPSTDLDGRPTGLINLMQGAGGLLVDGEPVVATRVLGGRVVLVITSSQVCVAATDYVRALRGADDEALGRAA